MSAVMNHTPTPGPSHLQLVKISDIIITPDRQRKEFDAQKIAELAESEQAKGLMHAPVMRETAEGLVLVAGECRIMGLKESWLLGGSVKYNGQTIPEGYTPYVTLGQLTPLQAEEAELDENLKRTDLSWQEKAAAMAKLHRIRSMQAQAQGRIHTVADTAMETKGRSDGSYQATVRKELIVARHLDNPEVMKAKTADEAFKILKKQEMVQKNVQLAAEVGKTYNSSIHELHNVNCLEWLRTCQSEQFDVILTDPPYGMGADSFGDGGGKLVNSEHHYKDDYDSWLSLMSQWAPLAFRAAKPQAHAYVFCDLDNFHKLKELMKAAGWYVFRTPFIACKPNSGRVPLPDEGPRRQWEMILYALKGHRKTTAIYPDVITTYQDANTTHGAQKPVALYVDLLRRSVRPGDVVLDSFAGSGTIFPACQEFKCKAVGLEMNPEYFSIAYQRIKEMHSDIQKTDTIGKSLGMELAGMMAGGK